jgi:gamma-glutamylcyclotransferase (GGCT)/AIG2-like uncharacterized protein YtfP
MQVQALFCYGSLQLPQVMGAVVGRRCAALPARVAGYAVRRLRQAVYPGLIPSPGAQARGVLYHDVTAAELGRLDRFEGEQYRRTLVEALPDSGGRVAAWVYLLHPSQRRQVLDVPWSLEEFVAKDLEQFMRAFVRGRQPQWQSPPTAG